MKNMHNKTTAVINPKTNARGIWMNYVVRPGSDDTTRAEAMNSSVSIEDGWPVCKASASRKVTREADTNSSKGIGRGPPWRTAPTNWCHSALWPLSREKKDRET